MNTKNYFIAIVVILAVMTGAYYHLDQNRDYEERLYCSPETRLVDACLDRQNPVCGWFDPGKVRCFTHPCAQDFSNECLVCQDGNVLYYTIGECPEPGD